MKDKLKIILILSITLIISQIVGNTIFLAGTPLIRKNLNIYIVKHINSIFSKINTNFFSFNLFNKTNKNQLSNQQSVTKNIIIQEQNIPFKELSKGIYAVEDKKSNIKKIEYRLDEIDWVEYTFNINGKEVKLKIPKNQPTPPIKILEQVYK
ncbi:MAG: hypothetical protein N2593_03610 [Patescibacteria group bacterium]|nr:hypothetical protein [Patescibacteria group bacterium]